MVSEGQEKNTDEKLTWCSLSHHNTDSFLTWLCVCLCCYSFNAIALVVMCFQYQNDEERGIMEIVSLYK